jgi:hypothetical protein
MNLKQVLDKWAEKLSAKAALENTPLQESTDAFKAVTAYYAATQKRAKKPDEDEVSEAGEFTFGKSDEVVNGEPRQRAAVHPRRNS